MAPFNPFNVWPFYQSVFNEHAIDLLHIYVYWRCIVNVSLNSKLPLVSCPKGNKTPSRLSPGVSLKRGTVAQTYCYLPSSSPASQNPLTGKSHLLIPHPLTTNPPLKSVRQQEGGLQCGSTGMERTLHIDRPQEGGQPRTQAPPRVPIRVSGCGLGEGVGRNCRAALRRACSPGSGLIPNPPTERTAFHVAHTTVGPPF